MLGFRQGDRSNCHEKATPSSRSLASCENRKCLSLKDKRRGKSVGYSISANRHTTGGGRNTHEDIRECLPELFCPRGIPTLLRSDNGPKFIAIQLHLWFNQLDVKTLLIAPGSPWENGYIEAFNRNMRDELLDHEIFFTLEEAKTLLARWREEYNHVRPHSALGFCPPAPQAWLLAQQPVNAPGLT
jgi:putative transposase